VSLNCLVKFRGDLPQGLNPGAAIIWRIPDGWKLYTWLCPSELSSLMSRRFAAGAEACSRQYWRIPDGWKLYTWLCPSALSSLMSRRFAAGAEACSRQYWRIPGD